MKQSKRSKSNLIPPAPQAGAKEPEVGPGSATCYCRRMDRRVKAEEARLALRGGAGRQIEAPDRPKFYDVDLVDFGDLAALYEGLKACMENGRRYRVRVEMVVMKPTGIMEEGK